MSLNNSAFRFTKGSLVTIVVNLIRKDSNLPYQIEDFTSVKAYFEKDLGSFLEVTGTLVSADLGKVQFIISAANSALLQAGEKIDFQVNLDQDGTETIFVIKNSLRIDDALYTPEE